jgi:hypothetical protein
VAEDWKIDVGVPNIGDIVEYRERRYRVSSWLRERAKRKPMEETLNSITDETSISGLMDDIFYEAQQQVHGKKLIFCYQEEASYLGLTGVGGTVAPVGEVKVVGKVDWSPEALEEARQGALRLAENGEVLF